MRKYLEALPEVLITIGSRRVTLPGTTSFETSSCWKSMEVRRDLLGEDFLGKVKIGYRVGVDLDGLRKRRELGFDFRDECIDDVRY